MPKPLAVLLCSTAENNHVLFFNESPSVAEYGIMFYQYPAIICIYTQLGWNTWGNTPLILCCVKWLMCGLMWKSICAYQVLYLVLIQFGEMFYSHHFGPLTEWLLNVQKFWKASGELPLCCGCCCCFVFLFMVSRKDFLANYISAQQGVVIANFVPCWYVCIGIFFLFFLLCFLC